MIEFGSESDAGGCWIPSSGTMLRLFIVPSSIYVSASSAGHGLSPVDGLFNGEHRY